MERTAMSRYSDVDPLAGMEEWDRYEPCFDEPSEPQPPADAFDKTAATLTPAQAQAAAHFGPILVLAGAGTGKTSTLTAAVVHRIAVERIPASRILAVTFTNKAAAEMASRIRAALDGLAAPSWLGTYHGLAARQLRDAPEIAELRPNFDIVDADDSRRFVKRVMKAQGLDGEEGVVVERKTGAVALHYRLRPELEEKCRGVAERATRERPDLEILPGKKVFEIRLQGADKGDVIEAFLKEEPFRGRMPIFAGDDVTDEVAFGAVNALGGLSIKVGRSATLARYRAADLRELHRWLADLARTSQAERAR
jgi:trehalose-phosphatase